jgi:peptide alpha-N-acetyltransferase
MIAADSATSLPIFPYGSADSSLSSSHQDKITECSVSSPVCVPSTTLPLAPSTEVEEGITRLEGGLVIEPYVNEEQLHSIARLIKADLSEPYSLYTYRYFIHNWPSLTFLCVDEASADTSNGKGPLVGAIVCKLEPHRSGMRRGYVAMLATRPDYRRRGIASALVRRAVLQMKREGCDEVVLETECSNLAAQRLYEKLGFTRDRLLFRYYLSGSDALRLKLFLT